MSTGFEGWIAERLPLPGVAAWSARLSDHTMAQGTCSDWFLPSQAEQTLNRLTVAADTLSQHHIQPVRLCWVFQHVRVHLTIRRDGGCLALFVENRSDVATAGIEGLIEEFLRLPAV